MADAPASAHLRLFIAVSIPEQVKAAIQAAQGELRRVLPGSHIRWARAEQFHLTLKFLGDVAAGQLPALEQKTREVCARFAPFEMRAEGIGFFPERGLPRVLWTGVQDREGRLPELQRALNEATVDLSSEAPEAKFTGHITLARFKDIRRAEAEKLREAVAGLTERRFGDWTASVVEIVRSELSPAGATHTNIAALPLSGR